MMNIEKVINLGGCTADSLHHNKARQSGFSLMHLHGNRASSEEVETVVGNIEERWTGEVEEEVWRRERGESIPALISL